MVIIHLSMLSDGFDKQLPTDMLINNINYKLELR